MIGINGVFKRFLQIVPLAEPSCTKEHHDYKKEAINEAFDQDELLKVLADKVLDLYPRERELMTLNTIYIRRAMVRILNSRYFDDINLIGPVFDRVAKLENVVAGQGQHLQKIEQRLQNIEQQLQTLEQGASK